MPLFKMWTDTDEFKSHETRILEISTENDKNVKKNILVCPDYYVPISPFPSSINILKEKNSADFFSHDG